MVFTNIVRSLRRVIHKKFGGYRRFILVLFSAFVILYVIRAIIEGDGSRQVWDARAAPPSENKTGAPSFENKTKTDFIPTHCQVKCAQGQYSFYIKTGEKTVESATGPTICFEGKEYLSDRLNNAGRGLNIVLVDAKTKEVKAAKIFDTFVDESSLLRFLKKEVQEDDIVLVATYDDAATGLKESGRQWLGLFGSSLIAKLKYRENFLMVGTKALAEGNAIEYYMASNGKEPNFAPPIEKAGCFALPLGAKVDMKKVVSTVVQGKDIQKGETIENCGLPQPCKEGTVAAAIYTGQGNEKKPSICVRHSMWMADKVNDAGRGFNIVVLNPRSFEPTVVTHMDTYEKDSTDLELMLDSLNEGDIVIGVVADEASRKLGSGARDALNKVGSGFIQNLRFRDVWYFVGQKGIQGFSRIEQLSYAGLNMNDQWPKPLNAKFCIPAIVPSSQIMIDPHFARNEPRRQFCTKNEGYTEFCNPAYVDEQLKAIPISNPEMANHRIFDIPIVIVPGIDHNAYVNTLRTTLMQPGIKVQNVAVFYDDKMPEYADLASLFGFKNFKVNSSKTYSDHLAKAMTMSIEEFPSAEFVMVIEEDILLAPDFIPFMAQSLTVVSKDDSLAGVFAWNINGFEGVSGDTSLVYRVQEFPGLGFLLRTSIVESLRDTWSKCCKDRAWLGWAIEEASMEMLMPDVSRAYRTPFFGGEAHSDLARNLFLKPRRTYLDTKSQPLNLGHLITTDYEQFLQEEIHNSIVLKPAQIIECVKGQGQPPNISGLESKPVVIFFEQQTKQDFQMLLKICHCFGLVIMEDGRPRNMHNGMLRFHYQNHDVFVVGTHTPYYDRLTSMSTVLSVAHFGGLHGHRSRKSVHGAAPAA